MLTNEQQEAFDKGFELYGKTCASWSDPLCSARLDFLSEALETMGKYVDEVDDIYYKVIFANIVQDMQDTGKFDLTEECQDTKIDIYLRTVKWFINTDSYIVGYKPYLWSVFNKLGWILIEGKEFPKNDHVAHICFECNYTLGHPLAPMTLELFEKDDSGKWVYTGTRPAK